MKKEEQKTETKGKIGTKGVKINVGNKLAYPVFSHFPVSAWEEWNEDCVKNYDSIRWLKAYSDHQIAKKTTDFNLLLEKITILEGRLDMMEQQPEEEPKEEEPKTLGGGD